MNRPASRLLIGSVLCVLSAAASASGEEEFGNKPLNEANFKHWPGIMPVVNYTSRVYRTWINGNEFFYYKGDTAALNDCLQKFAAAQTEVRQVVLRPGPGIAHTFDGKTKVPYVWNLHLIGGIAGHLTTLEGGDKVWSKHPVLTIYVGPEIELAKVVIPKPLSIVTLSELKERVREGLKSKDQTVRGWGCGELAALDEFDTASRDTIAGLLKDDVPWVRLNAASSLAVFGKKAHPALPLLRAAGETRDTQLKEQVESAIKSIELGEDRTSAERVHQATARRIQSYLSQQRL